MSSRNNNFSNRGQKLSIRVLASTASQSTEQPSSDNQPSSSTSQTNPAVIIASVIGGIILVALLVSAIYYRHSVSKKYEALKRQWKHNTSSYI